MIVPPAQDGGESVPSSVAAREGTSGSSRGLSFCLLTTFYPPASFGGDAVHVQRVAQGLARRGHRVRVVHSPTAYRMLGGKAVDAVDQDGGVEVVALPVGRGAAPATMATYLTGVPIGYEQRLAELTQGFDVVHFHNPSLMGGPGALALGSPDALRLYTTLEHWLLCPTHVLFRFGREVCEKRTCWRCTLSYRRPPQLWRSTDMLERGVDHLDAVVSPSRFTADLHRQAFPRARIETLPLLFWPEQAPEPANGADARRSRHGVQATPSGEAGERRPLFVFAGRLEPIKGADRLVRSFAGVTGADLVVAGTGAQGAELAQLAAANPAVRLVGRLPHREVLDLIRTATAVVVPSVGYETFGGIAVEAMAVGTPVVVRALGPLPELIEEGGGMAFADDEQLVEVLQELTDDPGLAQRLGQEAPMAASRFSTAAFFKRYFDILADVASGRRLPDVAARARSAAAEERP